MDIFRKRFLAALLALTFLAAALGTALPEARAEEEFTDPYVLSFEGDVGGYAYSGVPFLYTSPFQMYHTYHAPAGSDPDWPYTYSAEVFQLINTTLLAQGGEGAYASIGAYCTDVASYTRGNTNYRRINLEDSTYHASGAAARLRSVILKSFPYVTDMETIAASANTWLRANGLTEIRQLQVGEAILATQQAIWKITHGESYSIDDAYVGCGNYDGSNAVFQTNSGEGGTEYTENNIQMFFEYLMALPGTAPISDAVSEAVFEEPVYSAVREEDGTYTVVVSFRVVTQVGERDSLTLSARCGDQRQSIELTEGGSYQFTFRDLEDRPEVKLEINGYQLGGDVYLFDAPGSRDTSQSMVGYDDSLLPVHGEVLVTPDRILNILKTTSEAEGKKPLANISFEIYRVAELEQLERGEVTLGEKPTREDILRYQKQENLVATLTTDAQGMASYNFTENGQPDGAYLIVEQYSAATTGAIEPFFILIPGTTEDGSGHSYSLFVSPKNISETGPDIKKDVTEIENNSDSFDVGQEHTWILRGGVPAGIGSAQRYAISDTLDYRLTYVKGSPVVKLFTKAGEELSMTDDTFYTLAEGTAVVDGRTVDQFSVSLTAKGMAYVAGNLGEGSHLPEIRVYYRAAINENAGLGEQIPNQAHVDYLNSAGMDYDADSDIPEVHTGGIHLLKTDAEGNPLAGAELRIAREATEAELADESVVKQKLTVQGEVLDVVFVDFLPQADLSGEKVDRVVTGEDGKASFCGLAYGSYYLVETKAPGGYNLLTEPVAVQIDGESHLVTEDKDPTVRIINTKFVLPETGGTGTALFTVVGLLIIGSAAILIFMNSRKKKS